MEFKINLKYIFYFDFLLEKVANICTKCYLLFLKRNSTDSYNIVNCYKDKRFYF